MFHLPMCVLQYKCCGRRKPAIYWAQTKTKSGSLFLVFGQRLEMNQRTVSHSATVRSSEISDVSLVHAAPVLHSQHISF